MKLEVKKVNFSYGDTPLLEDIDFQIEKNSFTMILGANGSGKSTILSLASGLLKAQSGEVLLNGQNIASWSPKERAKVMALVPQNIPPALDFTVEQIVMMGRNAYLSHFGQPSKLDCAAVAEAMRQMEITHLASRHCNKLSGGERQRTMIAAALAQRPQILLLDEPTSALDPAQVINLFEVLNSLPDNPGILMAMHDLSVVPHFARELILLGENGKIHAQGKAREVFTAENIEQIYGKRANFWIGKKQ